MLEAFEQFISKKSLFSKKDSLLLAISGGKDSVALFHLLRQAGYTFEAAHCNFQLRDQESDQDQAFVETLCKTYNIKCHVKSFNTLEACELLGKGIQETARQLRYEWFSELMHVHQLDYVVTAHHVDDHLETIFIQLMRQSGISGMHGILPKQGHLVRPLLFASVFQIQMFLDTFNYTHRTDSSNSKDDYLRNAIRHHISPAIAQIDPEFNHKMLGFSERVFAFEQLFNDLLKDKQLERRGNGYWIDDLHFDAIQNKPLLLYYLLKPFGFPFRSLPTFVRNDDIQTGAIFNHDQWQLIRERNGWLLCGKTTDNKIELLVTELPFSAVINGRTIQIDVIDQHSFTQFEPGCLYLVQSKVTLPLCIRNWQAGDKIQPLGMQGHKLISDVLTDLKIPHTERAQQYVLTDATLNLLALIGHSSSEAFKINSDTEKIIRIQFI
jgi:tRNA(Ile)-lysidine synthase